MRSSIWPGWNGSSGLYERETRAQVDRLLWTGWGVTALILVALLVIGRSILRPASRTIGRQVAELARGPRRARGPGPRTDPGTGAASTATSSGEIRERSLAEERHRSLLEQFSHVSRTTTIGEMASGLAHELNQPLGAIANYTEGCLVALESPGPPLDEVRDALEKLLATTLRAGQIVKRIRRFVTRHGVTSERFEPNRLVVEVEEFFRDEARRLGIDLRLELAPELPSLWGDPVQIQQVLVNLVRNAFERFATSTVQSHGPCGDSSRTNPGPSSSVSPTMERGSRRSESTGSSTLISARVMKEWAWACPSAARSSRLTTVGSESNHSLVSGQPSGSLSHPQVLMMPEATVYIVDDDPDMRDSLRWLLKTIGLRVEMFESAADFLGDFEPSGPGCLVFDVRMPGMSGLDLFMSRSRRAARGCR